MMEAAAILEKLKDVSALVVGDVCLDRWCRYDPALADISRETGIPRTAVIGVECTPGAGGTVANNLAALGMGRVAVFGAAGEDGYAWELRRALAVRGVSSEYLLGTPQLQTFTYTKLLNVTNGEEDLARVDFINTQPLSAEVERTLVHRLEAAVAGADVIFVADQAETDAGGVVTPALRDRLAELARREPQKVFWVDSRLRVEHFRNMIVKPNQREAEEACQRVFGEVDFQHLREHVQSQLLLVTHGGGGVEIYRPGSATVRVPTRNVEHPVDICGAGDSFSAGAGSALAVTGDPVAAARFGNLVASITIMKKGTGTASPREVLEAERLWQAEFGDSFRMEASQ
jgi:rfaE bifunctional protein kinase chain/domain